MSLEFSFELTLSFNKAAVFWIAETGLADVEPLTKKEAKISFKTEQKTDLEPICKRKLNYLWARPNVVP